MSAKLRINSHVIAHAKGAHPAQDTAAPVGQCALRRQDVAASAQQNQQPAKADDDPEKRNYSEGAFVLRLVAVSFIGTMLLLLLPLRWSVSRACLVCCMHSCHL